VISATIDAVAERIASAAADWLRELIRQRAPRGLTLIGPAKCPVERIKMRWRWHFIVKAEHAAELTRLGEFFMRRFAIPKDAEARIAWDRDPVSLM
jgi:primosomal protein N' (replication factor Y)